VFVLESEMNLIGEEKTLKITSLFINQIHILIYKLCANFDILFHEILILRYFS